MDERENIKSTGAGTCLTEKKPAKRAEIKKRFSSKRLAFIAVFTALAYVVSILEIPLPLFGADFLKLDFGNVFILLLSFLFGPIEGVIACLLKESLRCINSTSLCAGELANFLITSAYLLIPSIAYQFRRTLKTVVWSLSSSCLIATGVALISNRYIIFPAFAKLFGGTIFGMTVVEAFSALWVGLLVFNLIKTVGVGLITMLLYKRLSTFFKRMKI